MTYKWQELTRSQQDYARKISARTQCPTASVSQVAKYLDDFAAFDRGDIDADELKTRTGHQVTE